MRCTNWQIISFAAAGLIASMSPVAAAPAQSKHVAVIDDAQTGEALLGHFDYVGSWQHVSGKRDGRTNGTSTRSTHTGDVAILAFSGTRVRLYGVCGPSGGRAGVSLDKESTGGRPIDFYAPHVETHMLVYQSPVLAEGVHTVSIAVWGTRNEHGRYYYVNIDGAEVDP
jgi:hypothetical protein